jgi:hypothetical protein
MFITIAAGMLVLGIVVGAGVVWAGFAIAPPITLKTLPVWLPALPFAVIALTLFLFGLLAWFWGTER